MLTRVIFKYRPPGPGAGLAQQDMPTIYSREAGAQEAIPEVGEIVGLPVEELDLPTSNAKEQRGEREMRFKVVDGDHGSHAQDAGAGDAPQEVTLIVTNYDA